MIAGEDPLQPVIDKRAQLAEQLEKLAAADTDAGGLDARIDKAERELDALAEELTAKRTAAAAELAPAVAAQLAELGMVGATLDVGFEAADDTPSGRDRVEFLARTNPGQPERPLRAIASGGELSRVMLALKGVIHGGDRISVLVFDEVDANIGGRLGSVIGRKLRELAGGEVQADGANPEGASPRPQVLCITHLAQIAAFGDRHFVIQKRTTGSKKTDTTRDDGGRDRRQAPRGRARRDARGGGGDADDAEAGAGAAALGGTVRLYAACPAHSVCRGLVRDNASLREHSAHGVCRARCATINRSASSRRTSSMDRRCRPARR